MTFNLYPLPPLSHGPHLYPLSLCLYPFPIFPFPALLVDLTFIPYPFAFILFARA